VSLSTIHSNFLFNSRLQSNKKEYDDVMMSKGDDDTVKYGNYEFKENLQSVIKKVRI